MQNCRYGKVHGCVTLGSESLYDHNIVLRNCQVDEANRVLWLKMRPDTPQHYEYITVENLQGSCGSFLFVHPWTQFYKMGDRRDMPISRCNNITMRHNQVASKTLIDVKTSDKYQLSDFTLDGKPLDFPTPARTKKQKK